jgi:hypothetical protein
MTGSVTAVDLPGPRLGYRQLALALEACPQRLAVHERHHVVQEAVGLPGVVQRQDVRMLQPRRQLDLPDEACRPHGGGQLGAKHLERDLAAVLQVFGEVHGGHAARPGFTNQAIAISEGGGEAIEHSRGYADGRRGERAMRCRARDRAACSGAWWCDP